MSLLVADLLNFVISLTVYMILRVSEFRSQNYIAHKLIVLRNYNDTKLI